MFDSLDSGLQNIIIFNHNYMSYFFFLFFVFAVSSFYIFYYKKNIETPTASIMVAFNRIILTVFSSIILFFTPYFMFILNPAIEDNIFVSSIMVGYNVYISLMVILLVIDFLKYAPFIILKMGGMDLNDPDTNRIYNNLKKEMRKLPFLSNGRK